MSCFRKECEEHCKREIEARMIFLVTEGDHLELKSSITKTRLYSNLTEEVPFMAFYDVKNARLCSVFEGEGLLHREPMLDQPDLERFLATVVPMMRAGRDFCWIMAGRTESNIGKIKKTLHHAGTANSAIAERLYHEVFYLTYNIKQMQQYGHWRRQRGIANSTSIEQLYCICFTL